MLCLYTVKIERMLKFQKDALLNRMENLKDLKEKISDERLMLVDLIIWCVIMTNAKPV